MKKISFILYSLLILTFVIGCGSMEKAYLKATKEDSIKSYEHFLKKYPEGLHTEEVTQRLDTLKEEKAFPVAEALNSTAAYASFLKSFPNGKFAEEARKRASASDREAFMNTCILGNIRAFQGFMESYPASKYRSLASGRIDYLKNADSGNLDMNMKFTIYYHNNPFAAEASASYPLLWLDRAGMKVGVVINVGEFVSWKGLLSGMRVTKTQVRQYAFDNLQKDIGKFGIEFALLDKPEDAAAKGLPIILVMDYSESGAQAESLANAVSDALTGPPTTVSTVMTIKDAKNGFEYYSKIRDLKTRADRAVMMKSLCGFKKESALPPLLVALYDKDPNIQKSAEDALKKITGQDFKQDRIKWGELWESEDQ